MCKGGRVLVVCGVIGSGVECVEVAVSAKHKEQHQEKYTQWSEEDEGWGVSIDY